MRIRLISEKEATFSKLAGVPPRVAFHLRRRMKSRILLIGKNGQVGGELAGLLPTLGELIALDRSQLDLAKASDIRKVIRDIQPAFIVNAAAYTAVDQAEKDPAAARAINAHAPAIMAEEAKKICACLVHYSTDYVFDGRKRSPYQETDTPNPLNVYGATKLAGEEAIQSSGASYLILRTSWVYGTRGRNFLVAILRLATQREELRIVRDQWGAPTSSVEIARGTAKIIERLIAQRQQNAFSGGSGIYHMTAGGVTTWHEFAQAILEEAAKASPSPPWLLSVTGAVPRKVQSVQAIPTEEYPTPARRPAYSVLSNSLIMRTFDVKLPAWRMQLNRLFVG
jgi:dTDP-4-dehydrorhamnose reductase